MGRKRSDYDGGGLVLVIVALVGVAIKWAIDNWGWVLFGVAILGVAYAIYKKKQSQRWRDEYLFDQIGDKEKLVKHLLTKQHSRFADKTARFRFYMMFNLFVIFSVVSAMFAGRSGAPISELLLVGAALGFLWTCIAYLGLVLIRRDKILWVLNTPFGRLLAKTVEAALDRKIETVFSKHWLPLMSDIEKFLDAHTNTGTDLPRPLGKPINWSEENFLTFLEISKRKGCELNPLVLRELLITLAKLKSKNNFVAEFLKRNPLLLEKAVPLKTWLSCYVSMLGESEIYLPNLIAHLNGIRESANSPSDANEKTNLQTAVFSQFKQTVVELAEERKIRILEEQMSSGTVSNHITIQTVDNMDGHQFEKVLERLFADMGYTVAPTRQRADQGADLVIEKLGERFVVQAKRYQQNVGNSAVQEVVAAKAFYKCKNAIVVTNSYFTRSAQDLAHRNSVDLWDRDKVSELLKRYPQEHLESWSFPRTG
jgi:hypothetical protein